jgi:dTDP-4-amino-4,6-dideoxygalactose transaminase
MDEPRAALLSARLPGLEADIAERRRLTHRYRGLLEDLDGISLPYTPAEVDVSSCYVMPVTVDDPELRDPLRSLLAERFGVQTTVLYPPINLFSAYSSDGVAPLPRCERAARTQLTLPLYPHLGEGRQDRVVDALREALAELSG